VSSFFLNFSLLFLTLEFQAEIVARSVNDGIGLQVERQRGFIRIANRDAGLLPW
jgi:hypothetical protein